MLSPETPFPYNGSYALLVDTDRPESEQRSELVRINWRREGFVMVSFPLREGASGNKTVAFADLIDGTPLSAEEEREFHDLDRGLAGRSLRTAKQKRDKARRDALRERMIYSRFLARALAEMRGQAQRRKAA
jgi:hypothetical protein